MDKRYEEALEQAKQGLPIDEVFLELKESEDEKIRKELLEEIEFIIPHDDETDSEGLILPSYHARIDRYKSYLEKQKEQKPVWAEIDKSRESVVFPFNARVKDSDKVVTIIDGQLNCDGKLWIRFASNKDDGFRVYNPEDLLVEQKPAEWRPFDKEVLTKIKELIDSHFSEHEQREVYKDWLDEHISQPEEWSEEDEKKYKVVLELINSWANGTIGGCIIPTDTDRYINWFKSFPERFNSQPHWKPSEEQLSALEYFIRSWGESGTMSPQNPTLCAAKTLLNDLKSL